MSASTFTAVDLSRLPALDLIETLDYEAIVTRLLADLRARDPDFDALVESDPAYKQTEVTAYAELLIRQRINEAAKAVMLAYAGGTALDHVAAGYNVERLLITPADPDANPPVDAVYESDADLRRRVQLAFEGYSTAGPDGAYLYHALSAHADVQDASVSSPTPGTVVVTLQSRSGDGTPGIDVLDAVAAALNADDVRPLTDNVIVQAAEIVPYGITAELVLWPGPDAEVVLNAANANLDDLIARQQRLGRDITRSALFAALHVEGVQNVLLTAPAADVVITPMQAAHCSGRSITYAGTDE